MEKLQNWNDWCNDKVVLHTEAGYPVLLSPNAILGLEAFDKGTTVCCVDGYATDVSETIEEVLGLIKELVAESEARKKAAAEAEEAARKAQYEAYMKAQQEAKQEG